MPFNETYCVMSLKLLRVARYGLCAQLLMMALQTTMFFVSPEVYNSITYGTTPAQEALCDKFGTGVIGSWLIHCSISTLCSIFLDFLVFFQTIEWKVMLDLILYQKDRTPDEIMDDHNQIKNSQYEKNSLQVQSQLSEYLGLSSKVSREEPLPTSQVDIKEEALITFRKQELWSKKFFEILTIALLVFLLICYPLGYRHRNPPTDWLIIVERCLLLLWCIWVFVRLFYSMMKMHKYEFKKNKH
mmetsp:Transcript_3240/g.4931  ORF Transcript_3240/g.4931 Transcript_3240/m.4931 type:complete len:243 (+) Transcript_3240:246-974(+)